MSVSMGLAIAICIIVFACAIAYMHERHRLSVKRHRFRDRECIDVKLQLQNIYPNRKAEHENMFRWWRKCATILKIDERKLRSEDRFDDILAPAPGFYTEDEVYALTDYVIDTCGPKINEDAVSHLGTFGEVVELLAHNAFAPCPTQKSWEKSSERLCRKGFHAKEL